MLLFALVDVALEQYWPVRTLVEKHIDGAGSEPHVQFMDEFDDARGRIPASNMVADIETCRWWYQSSKRGKPDDE